MNPTFSLDVKIIEVKRDVPYTMNGQSGMSASVTVRFQGVLVKVKARNDNATFLSACQANIDKDVKMIFEVFAGERSIVNLRAVSLAK